MVGPNFRVKIVAVTAAQLQGQSVNWVTPGGGGGGCMISQHM